ncbi:DNA polymerase Y family protein [Limnoglobus roseus]|uniref:DNA polymerase n=1 Tax=Limnoglobus roseus TaxID=2598579 RepID=A0A5C1AN97_9BACT|nr:DNA polymerase [Limnoglobus roseus]QEL18684.1 DNA polymerase [Limnoglobus roseus]
MTLRRLLIDMNSYFASVEQQDDEDLRGKPVAVVPVMARTTCCIAASREAKLKGVKTGMAVWEALQFCEGLRLVLARHDRYVEVHDQIVRAVARCLPIDRVLSIDEMVCTLLKSECHPVTAERLGNQIKAEIRQSVGECVTCSIGIAPNHLLAKLASNMKKPDGLTVIEKHELPQRLYPVKITAFSGIARRMEARFRKFGVVSTEQLCSLSVQTMSLIWGSKIHGERWFYQLRGEEVFEKPTVRRTVSHSHVLPPSLRNHTGARGVMVKLIHKAAARLRTLENWCGSLGVRLRYEDGQTWGIACKVMRTQDTLTLLHAFEKLWQLRPRGEPKQVAMVLFDLTPAAMTTPSLFDVDHDLTEVSHTMDKINRQFGKNSIHFGTLCGSKDTAPTRIAFTQIPEFDPAST